MRTVDLLYKALDLVKEPWHGLWEPLVTLEQRGNKQVLILEARVRGKTIHLLTVEGDEKTNPWDIVVITLLERGLINTYQEIVTRSRTGKMPNGIETGEERMFYPLLPSEMEKPIT